MNETAADSTTKDKDQEAGGEYVVIARRYRPQTFAELVGQQHVARALEQAIASDRVGHAYLFTGARGVGKTSAARILAKALNCVKGPTPTPCNECDVCHSVSTGDDMDVLEIDGASNNGVDEVRALRQNAAVMPSRSRYKIYIIDEVHMLSKSAFNALLKTLEEPPEHVKFIFATTEANKIPITILSRCQRFDFAGIDTGAIHTRLMQIAAAEGVEIEPEAAQILASRAAGSMRDSQSLLEQLLAVADKRITAADVNSLLGIAPVERLSGLVGHLVARDAAAALAELDATLAAGVDVGQLLDQLIGYFRDVMAVAVGCPPQQMLYALPSQAEQVAKIGSELGLATILAMVQILDQTAARLRMSLHGRTLAELAIVRICVLENLDELAGLVAELRAQAGAGPPADAAKKNVETRPASMPSASAERPPPAALDSIGRIPPFVSAANGADAAPPHAELPTNSPSEVKPANGAPAGAESVLEQFRTALASGAATPVPDSPQSPRVSRRQQIAEVEQRPFVRKAMDLFEIPPGQLRFIAPEGDADRQ
ncbi:MAG TPA: DNA polymerase III subunit gamma/tau [Lacipirellulaceae bacterium]|jgi:DNA polymerase-3 subunit gamma/tau